MIKLLPGLQLDRKKLCMQSDSGVDKVSDNSGLKSKFYLNINIISFVE